MDSVGPVTQESHDELRYPAHGQASVTFLEATTRLDEDLGATYVNFVHGSTKERETKIAGVWEEREVKEGYGDQIIEGVEGFGALYHENELQIEQTATSSGAEHEGFWLELYNGSYVGVLQEKGPEVSFNTSEATLSGASGRQNVLYGSGGWLGEANGAVEITAKDPGIGVSKVTIQDLTAGPGGVHWKFEDRISAEKLCTGIWCNETFKTNGANGMYFTYNKEMAEGVNTFELCAEDEALMKTCTDATVNVDDTPPREIKLSGVAEKGAEISATQHQITVEATDGTKPTPSSGVKSIAVSIDGREIAGPSASCPLGECTAKGTWTIDAESLGAGEHKLEIVATDNADNVSPSSTKVVTFAVRNATPMKIGPGAVDPVTGQFALSASDVGIAGAGGVSRSYESRSPAGNSESPLGPQWNLHAGSGQSLKLLPDGSAELLGSGGEPTIFALNKEGKLEAPKGDENLTLEAEEKEAGKGVTEYLLKDAAEGTTMVFTQPLEKQFVIPTYFGSTGPYESANHITIDSKGNLWGTANGSIEEFNTKREFVMAFGFGVKDGKDELETCTTSCRSGLQGGQRGEISTTEAIAVDAKGNIWAADGDNRIEEFNENGGLVAQFAEETYNGRGEGSDEIGRKTTGITISANGNVWVADTSNNRVDEFNEKREFVAAFGFGVVDGTEKFEVCTTVCQRGRSGTGNGQLSEPEGIAAHNGYIWVTDTHNNRVEKFSEKYEYVEAFGSQGKGNGQFEYPRHIAADSKGDLWVADGENGRIEEFSEAGAYLGQFGETGTESERLSWFDFWLGGGGVAVDSNGDVWVSGGGPKEWVHHRVWLPTRVEGSAPGDTRTAAYRTIMVEGSAVTEPIEELGPVPTGVSCGKNPAEVSQSELRARLEELKAGCRALSFWYSEKTTAIGESPSTWGEYNGRLAAVEVTAYNPASSKMETITVAHYTYDNKGRLRAEWDPRISPALKATYGYDSEGHVTALTPPGQQMWTFTYGGISGDASTGRLLKVTRAQPKAGASEEEVKTKLKEQAEQPTKTEAPKLSGTAVVGVKMGVSTGVWGKSPVAYAYQWEDCNSEEKECTSILGATNPNYTVASSDVGHKLVAVVTATNGGGSVFASTLASGVVSSSGTKTEGTQYAPQPGSTVEYRVPLSGGGAPYQMTSTELAKWGQTKDEPMEAAAVFPPDEPQGWPATSYKRATVLYMDGHARTTNTASPSGAISTVEYNSLNEVTRQLTVADRALAMKEGGKSAEVANALSSEKFYNGETQAEKEQEEKEVSEKKKPALEPGARLRETLGPEHKVKLPNGTEEETRDRQKFSYNEGEPSKGETYNLLTKKVSWAEGALNKELDKHEKTVSYSDSEQSELGWTLRKPILITEKVGEQTSTESTKYNPETGQALETFGSTTIAAPVYASQFGSSGSGIGQFSHPMMDAVDSSGNVWVADAYNNRIEKFSSTGTWLASYGKEGSSETEVQFKEPVGIAINQKTGNVYVGDQNNNRVVELSSSGKLEHVFGKAGTGAGEFKEADGVAIDSKGNVWVTDSANERVNEFSETGTFIRTFGFGVSKGESKLEVCTSSCRAGVRGSGNGQFSNPSDIAISGEDIYVTDLGNARVEEFDEEGKTFVRAWGSSGAGNGQFKYPSGITSDANGNVYVADEGNARVQQFSPTGQFLVAFGTKGSGNGQMLEPEGVAVAPSGAIYVTDAGSNNRVQTWEPAPQAPVYTSTFGTTGSETEKLAQPQGGALDAHGDIWVTSHWERLEEFSAAGSFMKAVGSSGAGAGQMNNPGGVAINQSNNNVYVADGNNQRVDEFNEKGEFVRTFGFGVKDGKGEFEICTSSCQAGKSGSGSGQFSGPLGVTVEPSTEDVWVTDVPNNRVEKFKESGEFIEAVGWGVNEGKEQLETCTTTCKAGKAGAGNGEFNTPALDVFSNGVLYVTDLNNQRVQELNEKGEYLGQFGSKGSGNGQFTDPAGISADTQGNLYVTDVAGDRVEEFTPSGNFLTAFGDNGTGNGQMMYPMEALSSGSALYVIDTDNHRIEKWTPAPNPGNEEAKDSRTTYYSAAASTEYPECGKHPEWANLTCRTEPDVQPGDSGPSPLPVKTVIYNMWDEPETLTEKIGSVTRTIKKKYDGVGRETENEETSTSAEDSALPAVTDEYNSETGAMIKLTETLEGKAKTVTSVYNTLGQLTSYTDAEGSTTKYKYDIDGRIEEVNEPKGYQIYSYEATTGFMTKLLDSAAGTFTATYGVAGEMLSEGYPNGMTAKYTYNPVGQTTNLEYEKTTHCSEKCVWFNDAEAFGPQGELATQTSTLSSENYSYNEEGQLTQTQETPVGGKGCVTRLYGYNESMGERTSLATREPNEKGECSGEGGLVEGHAYDVVGRLLDPGVTYDALGNMTKVPALDAGGQAITSSFYVDNQVATQEQSEKKLAYSYDPAGRTMIAKLNGKSKTISHYAGSGQALTWTCEEEEGKKECEEAKETKWTRNIPGIEGALDAIQTNGGTPVLQLHDLEGNIVATAADNETEMKLLSTQNSTEFGVVPSGKAPKYAWLGASDAESELETGVITSAGATYVPQLARTIATEQVIPPGAAPNGVMATEAYCPPELPWANQSGNEGAANTVAQQRAREQEQEEALVLGGSSIDPWGLLTGKEALEFANEFNEWAKDVQNYKEHRCRSAECNVAAEVDVYADKWMAEHLENCYKQVHEPGHVKYNGKNYTVTSVCLVHLKYKENFGGWIFAEPGTGIWIGRSLPFDGSEPSPWGNHGPDEWYFENIEKPGNNQWWVFGNNRGWWRKIQ